MTAKLIVVGVLVVAIFGYFAWKYFAPEESTQQYPHIEDFEKMPGFLPQGKNQQNIPQAPEGRYE